MRASAPGSEASYTLLRRLLWWVCAEFWSSSYVLTNMSDCCLTGTGTYFLVHVPVLGSSVPGMLLVDAFVQTGLSMLNE